MELCSSARLDHARARLGFIIVDAVRGPRRLDCRTWNTQAVPYARKLPGRVHKSRQWQSVPGYAIGYLTGNVTADGFNLQGTTALILFAVIIVYFVVGSKYLGGTVWQRILY